MNDARANGRDERMEQELQHALGLPADSPAEGEDAPGLDGVFRSFHARRRRRRVAWSTAAVFLITLGVFALHHAPTGTDSPESAPSAMNPNVYAASLWTPVREWLNDPATS